MEPRQGKGPFPGAPGTGGGEASDRLLPVVYEELRRLAHRRLAGEPRSATMQTTDLVHEAYLRLMKGGARWANRAHFFAAAAIAMRRILVEAARRRRALKHGGDWSRVSLDGAAFSRNPMDPDLIALDEALVRLESFDKRLSQIVMLRFFAGLGIEETAETMGLSPATVKRDWIYAKTWLHHRIARGGTDAERGGKP